MKTKMSRKVLLLFLSFAAYTILSSTTCGEPCDNYEDDLISCGVKVSATITYNNSTAYEGLVVFSIKLITCQEDIAGYHNLDQIPSNAEGKWDSGETYTYSMDNVSDEIIVRFHFEHPTTSETFDPEYIIEYYDIENLNLFAFDYPITLPWGP